MELFPRWIAKWKKQSTEKFDFEATIWWGKEKMYI